MLFVGIDADSGEPVGTAGLVENDLSTRTDLRPWVASVYTDAFRRGQGIGSAMMRHVEEYAYAKGFDHIYLYTPDAVPFYEGLGWHVYDRGSTSSGHTVTIMRKDFAPKRRGGEPSFRDKVEEKRRQEKETAERELAAVKGAKASPGFQLDEDPFGENASRAASSRPTRSSRGVGGGFSEVSRAKQMLALLLALMLIPASMMLFRNYRAMSPEDRGAVDLGGPADKTTIAARGSAGGARPNAVFADAKFEAVVRRKLSINVAGIALLSQLREISLRNNDIGTLRPLLTLPSLVQADLRDNPFHCPSQRRNLEKIRAAGVEILTDCGE